MAESDDPDGAKPIVDGTSNTIAILKFDGLKKKAQQIVNNLEGIGNEAKALGFTKQNFTILQSGAPTFAPQQLQQMGKELEKFGVAVPAASVFFQGGNQDFPMDLDSP